MTRMPELLPPSQKRSLAPQAAERAALARHTDHEIVLSGLRETAGVKRAPPLLVERSDQEFVEGLLADLQAKAQLTAPRRQTVGGVTTLRLYPPVQRRFNLAVLEAFCYQPGQPRLDAAKVEGAGIVVRRVVDGQRYAWIKAGPAVYGWARVDEDVDPALDKRALPHSIGPSFVSRQLDANRAHLNAGAAALDDKTEVTEQITPLFVAPPGVCSQTGKTLLFAVVPVASSEQAETPPTSPAYGTDSAERATLQAHLIHYLKSGAAKPLPHAGALLSASWLQQAGADDQDLETSGVYGRLGTFMLLLQQLHLEFGAFAATASGSALLDQLNRISVERDTPVTGGVRVDREPAGEFLRKAKAVLLDNAGNAAGLRMPQRWGAVDGSVADALFQSTLTCLNQQFRLISPAQGRFDDPAARYVLRAFIRVKPEQPACPPRLVWSDYSAEFTISPWHESAGGAPTLVPLPDLFDKNVLASLKPNVAFSLPPKLANLLQANAKKLRDGEVEGAGTLDLQWICAFSIPIITLCAFIVLNIFLQLLNLIFFWLPFLKICIPFPKKLPGPPA